jgi:protein-S-isoprenylcysteine O-methyltransferase Ste14
LGFCFAAVFLWLARPSWVTLGLSLLLVAPGVWLRGYAAGYVRKNMELTRTGPYGHTRNPLYLGSMMIAFGFAGAAGSWVILVALVVLFAAIYWPTIKGEEAYLREKFAGFEEYARSVPRLLPRLTAAPTDDVAGSFSSKLYLHHREYNAFIGAVAIYAALAIKLVLVQRGVFAGN